MAVFINSIDVDGRVDAFGIDNASPVFHFTLSCTDTGEFAKYVQLELKLNNSDIDNTPAIWDTGKIKCPEMPYIKYEGPALKPRTSYAVRMQAWNTEDECRHWSIPVIFETGLMDDGFEASWIEPVQEDAIPEAEVKFFELLKPRPDFYGGHVRCHPAKDIRKTFFADKKVINARAYVSAHGVYEFFVNGKKAGTAYLAPEISSYKDYLYYQTYDITELLNSGENVLAITLADGWWTGRIGLAGYSCQYGNRIGLILQTEIEYEDGSTLAICSDDTFKCNDSAIEYADLFIGEKIDMRKNDIAWKETGFNDESWEQCSVIDCSKDNLIAQPIDPIVEIERIPVQRWIITPNGEMVADFGKIVAGTIDIEIEGWEGQEVTMEFSEVLNAEGNFFHNIMGRNKDQTDVMICRLGIQRWKPCFSYHGFRYIKFTGTHIDKIKSLEAVVIMSRLKEISTFYCSDERLNSLQRCIKGSEHGNFVSITTDCPQREKMGWTGDTQLYAKTGLFNLDLRAFYNTWLMNLRSEQLEDGAVPVIVPAFPKQMEIQKQIGGGDITSSGWSDACIMVPWYMYQNYGDISALTDNLVTMQRFLKYIACKLVLNDEEKAENKPNRSPYLWNVGYHYGDWLIPSVLNQPGGINIGRTQTREVVGSCWYAIIVDVYIKICRILQEKSNMDLENEIAEKTELLKNIKKMVKQVYVAEDGTVDGKALQGLYVIVLKAGVVEGTLRQKVVDKLIGLIKANGYRLDTGYMGTGFLLDTLTECGYKDIAYKLLFQDESPSWLYMVNHGATTMWEAWEAVTPDGKITDKSFNHLAFGCVGDWMYKNISGIFKEKAGYKDIRIEPDLDCGLNFATCSHVTPFGTVSCNWQKNNESIRLDIVIPPNVNAVLKVGTKEMTLQSGRQIIEICCANYA